jgi:hypothetical protein
VAALGDSGIVAAVVRMVASWVDAAAGGHLEIRNAGSGDAEAADRPNIARPPRRGLYALAARRAHGAR